MIGKKIKLNDYKFTYGQETIILNVYGAFEDNKSGNKYVIYSYDNNKLFYGSFFIKNSEAIIMVSKGNPKEIIWDFINLLLEGKKNEKYEIISLKEVETIQIIDEYEANFKVDMNKLFDLTIPKPVVEEVIKTSNKKKAFSIATFFFAIFVLIVIAFFFINPQVIIGKNRYYVCNKTYSLSGIPVSVNDEVKLNFNSRGKIVDISIISDYVFSSSKYYNDFKEKGYFYQYMEEGDTYKFIDDNYTYRLFSSINIDNDFFLPDDEFELISHYNENNYICKGVEVDE